MASGSSGIETLVEWAVQNGAKISDSLRFKNSEDRGVYAISHIDQEEPSSVPQLQIPIDLIIRSELSDEYFGIDSTKLLNPNGPLKLLLAKFKFDKDSQVKVNGKDLTHFFEPYVDLLPFGRQTNSPFYWNSNEKLLLQNTNLGGSLDAKLYSLLQEWKSTVELLPPNFKSDGTYAQDLSFYHEFSSLEKDEMINQLLNVKNWTSFGAYLWSSIIFTSRAFPHHIINSKAKDGQAILLPLIDLLNHDNKAKADWTFQHTSNGDFFSLHNKDCVKHDEEVFNNYGAKGNEELLMGYGFVIGGNTNDTVALRIKLPINVIRDAETFGVKLPHLDDYTHHAFLTKETIREKTTDYEENYEDGLLYFINRSNLIPTELLSLFSFLVNSPDETSRTLRSDLAALQNLRGALEHKEVLIKQRVEGIDETVIDSHLKKIADMYRKGQREIYKLALAEIKSAEKALLSEYKSKLLTLKKILKRDDRLLELLSQFGLGSYESIQEQDFVDVVLFLWLILNSVLPLEGDESYEAPLYLVERFNSLKSSPFESNGEFKYLYQSLAATLQKSEFLQHVTERNIAIASEVIKNNSYVRISNNEIILVEPVNF